MPRREVCRLRTREDRLDNGWRQEGQRQGASNVRTIDMIEPGDLADRATCSIGQLIEIVPCPDDQSDQRLVRLCRAGRSGQYQPALRAAAPQRHRMIQLQMLSRMVLRGVSLSHQH